MSQYIIRIQLESAELDPSYEVLHEAMKEKGFSKSIPSTEGLFDLPRAMYYITSTLDLQEVLRRAKIAADSTGKKSMVLAIEVQDVDWNNLNPTED
jgi:hypothetical protein